MKKLETVEIVGQHGQPLIINKKDFDKELHVLFKDKEELKEEKPKKKRKVRKKKEDKE